MFLKSSKYYRAYNVEKEKRYRKRVPFSQDIKYPIINGKSFIEESKKNSDAIIEVVDINEFGIGIRSKLYLSKGDFLNLCIKFDDSPTFEILCIVKWTALDDKSYLSGCEFCYLRNEDRKYIRDYMDLNENF